VLRLVRDERTHQNEHIEYFTVADTPQMSKIQHFQIFEEEELKKLEYLKNG